MLLGEAAAPAYVSIRQHTSMEKQLLLLSIRQHTSASSMLLGEAAAPAYVSMRQHTSAYVDGEAAASRNVD